MGASNKVADVLSRKEEDKELQLVSRPYWQDVSEIDAEGDPILSKINELKQYHNLHSKYTLEHPYSTHSIVDVFATTWYQAPFVNSLKHFIYLFKLGIKMGLLKGKTVIFLRLLELYFSKRLFLDLTRGSNPDYHLFD